MFEYLLIKKKFCNQETTVNRLFISAFNEKMCFDKKQVLSAVSGRSFIQLVNASRLLMPEAFKCCLIARVYGVQFISYLSIMKNITINSKFSNVTL